MLNANKNLKPHLKKRVFLDIDSLTAWDVGIYQRFPQPERMPLCGIEAGPPGSWDAALTSFGQVIKEDGKFRMWYYGMREPEHARENCDRPLACYAESDDGVNWRKPDLGITGQKRYPGNNLLAIPGAMMGVVPALPGTDAKYLACTIMYPDPLEADVTDIPGNPNPLDGGAGTHIWASDDGLNWRHVMRVLQHGDWACLFTDFANNRYLLHNKCGAIHGLTSRRIAIGLESKDGEHWEGYDGIRQWRETFMTDDFDDLIAQQRGALHAETYTAGIYRAGEILVSTECILNVWPPQVPRFAQNPNGIMHVRLGFSHDGFKWRYPKGRPVWMEPGMPGTLDAGCFVSTSTLVEDGDDMLFYYGGTKYDHGWSINTDFSIRTDIGDDERDSCRVMMAKIKRDRFASLASTYINRFDVDADHRMDEELFVNVIATNGEVRVALAEKTDAYHGSGRKHEDLPGYSFEDCIPITGDEVRAKVQFKNARVSDIPYDKPLTVRFELNRAEIFAFEWGARSTN